MKRFSKFKKQIDNLFEPELEMKFCCYSYPMRSQYGSTSIPRFCVKMGKEVIWDVPKDFKITESYIHAWSGDNKISELVRDYIDTPIEKLLATEFENEKVFFDYTNHPKCKETLDINYGLTEIFKAADRRIGKAKLVEWAKKINNPTVNLIIEKRF